MSDAPPPPHEIEVVCRHVWDSMANSDSDHGMVPIGGSVIVADGMPTALMCVPCAARALSGEEVGVADIAGVFTLGSIDYREGRTL